MSSKHAAIALLVTLAGAGACKKEKEPPNVDNIIRGSKPELPQAIAGVKLDGTVAELSEKIPADQYGYHKIRADGVSYEAELDFDKTRVTGVVVAFPDDVDVAERAKAVWGAGLTGTTGGAPSQTWANEDAGVLARAWAPSGVQRLAFSAYAPISRTFAKDGAGFAFEKHQPILGATKEELAKAYPTYEDAGARQARIRLGSTICSLIWTTVKIRFGELGQEDQATSMSIEIDDEHCETPPEELERALGTFGPAQPNPTDASVKMFSQDPMIALQKTSRGWTIAAVGVGAGGAPS